MSEAVDVALFREAIAADASRIAELANSHASSPVAHCPGWDITRLAGHVGRVHRMAIGVLMNSVEGFADPDSLEKPPADPAAMSDYLRRGAAELDTLLGSRDPRSPAWNFLHEPMHAYFWVRRMAHETAIHRFDAENAAACAPGDSGEPSEVRISAVGQTLAVDGVDEYFVMVRERLLAARNLTTLGGTLHLHATDAPGEWTISVVDSKITVDPGHAKGDAAIRGTANDLLLGVWGRRSLVASDVFERFGSASVVETFATLGGT